MSFQITTTREAAPPSVPGFDSTRFTWVQTAPGKWTVEEKVPEPHPLSAAYDGPSLRDLIGGDLNLTLSGDVSFNAEDVEPREDPPAYGRKSQSHIKRVDFQPNF